MGKKHRRSKIAITHESNNGNHLGSNYLLGSSADTFEHAGDNYNEHNFKNHIHIHKKQTLNYAILNDDIVEEAALLSSSEGYDAELDSQSSSANVDMDSTNSPFDETHGADDDYPFSIHSEISDSVLLLEERGTYSGLHWFKRPSVLMIYIAVFLYTYSLGMALAPELQLALRAICYWTDPEMKDCSSNDVQQANAYLQKWSNFLGSIIKILVSAKMGILSDIYGRKPLIVFNFLLATTSKIFLCFVLTPKYFTFARYVGSVLIEAFGGSVYVLLSFANSYAIDVVDESKRLQTLGGLTGMLFLGLSLGPATSSLLSIFLSLKPLYLVILSSLMFTVSTILVLAFLPESRSDKLKLKSRRSSLISRHTNKKNPTLMYKLGLSSFVNSFYSLKLLWISRPLKKGSVDETTELLPFSNQQLDMSARYNVLILVMVEILLSFCTVGATLPVALFIMFRFKLDQSQLGWFIGGMSGSRAMVLTVLNPWLQQQFLHYFIHDPINVDFIDVTSISIAVFAELFANVMFSIAPNAVIAVMYVFITALASIGAPVIHSTLLKYNSSPGKNGEFFGALALIRNLVILIAPWTFLTIYSYGLGIHKPEIIFQVIVAIFIVIAILLGNLRFVSDL